jgi:hypothetical protein
MCSAKSEEFIMKGEKNDCFICREPLHHGTYWARTIKPNDQRHWLLSFIGLQYSNGTQGLEQNTKKGLKLIERAAELGDAQAHLHLAGFYHDGYVVPENLEKAIYYAEKAADQGLFTSQSLLGNMLMHSPDYNPIENEEKVLKFLTIASYQGCPDGRFDLASFYAKMADKFNEGEEDWMKYTLLTLYWYGKAGEAVKVKDPKGCESIAFMAYYLTVVMRCIWHPQFLPLQGYSHFPFSTWLVAKGGQYSTGMNLPNPWISHCANCNKSSEEDNTQFKACARCKTFYYCSKECQVEHWKDGHKVDCKGHWIKEFFPDL